MPETGMLLNKPLEMYRCRRIIRRELGYILNSSRNYVLASAAMCLKDVANLEKWNSNTSKMKLESTMLNLHDRAKLKRIIYEHRQMEKMIEEWLAKDKLIPIARSSEWIHGMAKIYSTYNTSNLIYSIILDSYLFIGFHLQQDAKLELDFMDIVGLCELFLQAFLNIVATSFYLSIFNATINYQLRQMKWLKDHMMKQVDFLQARNQYILCQSSSNDIAEQLISIMNKELLLALTQYKLFLSQLQPIKVIYIHVGSVLICVAMFVPISIRLHMSYWLNEHQVVFIYMALTCLIFADTALIPMCQMHHIGSVLSTHLWTLLAHSVEVNGILARRGNCQLIYYEHILQMYHKELHDPERLSSQFAVKTFFGKLTYPNLVKIHYWFGILLISAFFEMESWRKLLGSRMNDPLGVFIGY